MKQNPLKNGWLVLLSYTLLSLLFTWPLIAQINQSLYGHEIVGWNYDPFGTMEKFLSIKNQFLDQKKLFLSPYTYPGTDYPGALLTALWNEVAAFNLLLLLSFPLSGFFAYLLARHLTQNRLAAFWGGLLYAFSPYHWVHAYYHLGLAQIQWFPLYLLSLFLFIETPDLKRGLSLFLSLGLLVFSNYYYAFFALILTCVFFLYYGVYFSWPERDRILPAKGFRMLLAGMAAAGCLLFLALIPNLTLVYRNLGSYAVAYEDLFRYGSRPWGFVLPPPDNPLLGWISRDYVLAHREGGLVEHTLYLGLVPVLLSLVALWGWLRKKEGFFSGRFRQAIPFFAILSGAALVCSRPPVMTAWGFEILMPSHFLYSIFPMFRSYARFGLLVYLSLSVLAAAGLSFLMQKRKPLWIWGLALLLLGVEYANIPPFRTRPLLPTEAHRWLARESRGALVVDYAGNYLAGITPVRRLLQNTLLPRTEMEAYNLYDFSDLGRLFRVIGSIGGQYILVPQFPEAAAWERESRPFQVFRDSLLFKPSLPKEAVVIRYEAGFYSLEKEAGAYIRWMAEEGVVLLINRSGREMKADLELEWVSFRAPKNIRLEIGPLIGKEIRENTQTGSPKINFRLDNALRQDLWVSPDGGRHTLKNLRLLPGFTALKLAVLPAGGEREVLKDAHNRLVSIGLKKIQWIEKTGEK